MVLDNGEMKNSSDNWFLKSIIKGRFTVVPTAAAKIILLFAVGVLLFGFCIAQGVRMTFDIDKNIKEELNIGITKAEARQAVERIRIKKSKWVASKYVSIDDSTNEWKLTVREGDIYSYWVLSFEQGVLVKKDKQKRPLPPKPAVEVLPKE